MSDRIAELAALIAGRIPGLIEEARDQINESINATMEDAQERENGKAILSLAITAKWNLDTNTVEVSMPVTVKRKFTRTVNLPDHNQENLPFLDTEEATETTEASKAVKKIVGSLRAAGVKVITNAKLTTGGINE